MRLRILFAFLSVLLCVKSALLAVDYGEEYTKAILIAPSVPLDVLLSADSKRKDVSGVSLTPVTGIRSDIQRSYGFHALSACIRNPSGCLTYVKPLLGKSPEDPAVDTFATVHPGVEIIPISARNSTGFRFQGTDFSVEEVVAMNFADIKRRALGKWNELSPNTYNVIDEIAISIPRYYTHSERRALIDAAEIAGLKVVALVDDGVSAAISYAQHREFSEEKQYHLIYDMGAGSTKATLISLSTVNDTLSLAVEGYGYDRSLGGHNFTAAIKEILVEKFLAQNIKISREEFTADARAMNKLWQAADKAKLVLSANTLTRVSSDNLYAERDFRCAVKRTEFEQRISEQIDSCSDPLETALGNFDLSKLQSVILAGGSTRVPAVQRRLTSYLGDAEKISRNINADEAVVFGLAMRGANLAGYKRRLIIDVLDRVEFEYSIASSETSNREVVIPSAAPVVGQLVHHNFTETAGKLDVILYEDENPFRSYSFDSALTLETCPDGLNYSGDFAVSKSGIVHLKSVRSLCYKEGSPVTTSKLSGNADFWGFKPLTQKQVKESVDRLSILDKHDEERIHREGIINSLEASLYEMRAYIEEEQVIQKGPEALVKKARKLVDELLSWLDENSLKSTSKEIQKKLDKIRHHKKRLDTYVQTPDEFLTLDKFIQLSNDSTTLMHELQDFMVTMSEDAMEMKESYDEFNLNFDETNAKLKLDKKEETETELKEVVEHINEFANIVKKLEEDPDQIKSKSRVELIDLREASLSAVEKLKSQMETLRTVHDLRIGYLRNQLRLAQKARVKKAMKEKAKRKEAEKEEAKKLEAKKEEAKKVEELTESQTLSSTPIESSTSTQQSHDEL
ncbi:DEKNAAC102776 [Brettanomyces naardenensis]|uniref:DEKNAAC102776 n=1 Tax=Brettanomyces naardenensis TaxID=13370 RepID=A0A448YL68_BRENA|nr:DEKNAAC102776 [Brettanomyces naardenensis]